MASAPQLPTKGFIREAQLIPTFVPFSSATLWRKVKNGDVPRPVKLSERVTAWRLEDVHACLQAAGARGTDRALVTATKGGLT